MSDSAITARVPKSKKIEEIDAKIIYYLALYNMNRSEVARELYLSNTAVVFHVNKIRKITGLDPRNFFDLGELYSIALEILGDDYESL